MDDRGLRLLEEIRDLQREHLELYRGALQNQAASIRMQEEAMRLQGTLVRRVIPALLLLAVVIAALLALLRH